MSKRFFQTSNGIKGGELKGKAHYDSEGNSLGGIKAVVTDQGGTPVELEGNEVIINKKTVQSDKVLTVKGTPKEILSTLNQMDGNGVAIGDEEAEILAKYREGGEIPSLIEKGVVDLKFHETTPEHAEIYGLTAEKPLYIQTLYVNDNKRLKGIGSKVLHYIYSIAKQNGNDVIFGHINQKASFSKDEKETTFNDIDMVKNWLHKNGYAINEDNNDFHKVVKFKTGGSIGDMTPSELKEFYASPEGKKLDAETYAEWKSLVNMTKAEITNFYNSPEGKQAGLSESEANKQGIDSGRESARWIMKMKDIPYKEWTSNMWRWAKKQIGFIKRMSGVKGELYDDKGRKTRKHTALLIWGHNPEEKFAEGGSIGFKEKQLEIINRTNPAPNNYNTWIRNVEDIKTAEEAFSVAFEDGAMYPDFETEDMNEAIESGFITIYSSYPIKDGVFITPSKMNAQDYAGGKGGKIYSKKVSINDVAWIDESEGQFASVTEQKFKGGGEISQKALAVETTDLKDYVRKYFIKDGRIDVSDAMQEMFGNKSGKSIAGEYRKRIGLHKKGGLTISQLSHKLWEEHKDDVRGNIDDSDFREAVEEVITSEYGVNSMINNIMEKSSQGVNDDENEYWMNQYDDSQYNEPLNDEEMNQYFRDMEGFEHETYKGEDKKIIISGVEIPKEIDELFKEQYKLSYYYSFYGDVLNSFPKDEMGLTTGSARATKEYKDVKQKYDLAKRKANEFNLSKEGKELSEFYSKIDRMSRIEVMKHYTNQAKELDKGTEHEMEHLETLKKVAEGKVTPEEAVVETAKTHIAENPEYYEDLAKMEAENEGIKIGTEFYDYYEPIKQRVVSFDSERVFSVPVNENENYQYKRIFKIDKFKEILSRQDEFEKEINSSLESQQEYDLKKELETKKQLIKKDEKDMLSKAFSGSKLQVGKKLVTLRKLIKYNGLLYTLKEYIDKIFSELNDDEKIEIKNIKNEPHLSVNNSTYKSLINETGLEYFKYLLSLKEEQEESIPELIEGLKVLADSLEGAEKKEIEDVIEGLEILLESDNKFAEGGSIGSVLWATKIGEPDYNEQLITENSSQIENAKKWAVANGFDRIRVSTIDNSKPDFTKGFKKYKEGGELRMATGGKIVFKPITTPL